MLDRHRDALPSRDPAPLAAWREGARDLGDLIGIVRDTLSPRDDDWIAAGMELGLVSDVMQFGHEDGDEPGPVTETVDARGGLHRRFRLGRPATEVAWSGALADPAHPAARGGLWNLIGWDPAGGTLRPQVPLWLDIDLDYCTISWETYVVPYPAKVMHGEFLRRRQNPYGECRPAAFFRAAAACAGGITVATEPAWCGGAAAADRLLRHVNRIMFGGALETAAIRTAYPPAYPTANPLPVR